MMMMMMNNGFHYQNHYSPYNGSNMKLEGHSVERMYLRQRCSDGHLVERMCLRQRSSDGHVVEHVPPTKVFRRSRGRACASDKGVPTVSE